MAVGAGAMSVAGSAPTPSLRHSIGPEAGAQRVRRLCAGRRSTCACFDPAKGVGTVFERGRGGPLRGQGEAACGTARRGLAVLLGTAGMCGGRPRRGRSPDMERQLLTA